MLVTPRPEELAVIFFYDLVDDEHRRTYFPVYSRHSICQGVEEGAQNENTYVY